MSLTGNNLSTFVSWTPVDKASGTVEQFIMLNDKKQSLLWDGLPATLGAAKKDLTVVPIEPVEIYQGPVGEGSLLIFFCYRSENGMTVFNGEQATNVWAGKE